MPCCKDTGSPCACRTSTASTATLTSSCGTDQCGHRHDHSVASTATLNGQSVRLPRREANGSENPVKPPVWAIDEVEDAALAAPLPAKCDRHADRRHGICCKELRGEDERTLVDPDVVRDVVIGLSDGLTVPFALTAGLSSIGDSKIVVVGGLAELIAGAISMGVGGFLASQSERDHFRYLRQQTRERVQRSCEGEIEREVHAVLGPLGVEEKLSMQLADNLRRVEDEMYTAGSPSIHGHGGLEDGGSLKWSNDVGITAFLLKFGEGMEEIPTRRLYASAFTIGMGYFIGGLVPLIPYFFVTPAQTALVYSSIVTGIILLIFGAVKTHVTGATGGWRGYMWGAVSMLAVGGGAAAAAFGIVKALET